MICAKNIGKTYIGERVSVEALKGVNISLPERGLVFILGKSGCGKSTLLNLLGGLDGATTGGIFIDGVQLGKALTLQEYRSRLVGFVFQEFHLNKTLNVEQNVMLSDRLAGRAADLGAVHEALKAVGLESKAKNKVTELSGGEQQRVAIARALVKKPRIILADEPTGKLDEANGELVYNSLKQLSQSSLIVVVSHDRESAERYGDRIIRLADGEIVSDESKAPPETNDRAADAAKQKAEKAPQQETALAAASLSSTPHSAGLKNAVYLAYKNIVSRPVKTISTILVCSLLFAVMGLSAIIFAFSPYGALQRTLEMHLADNNNSVVLTQGHFNAGVGSHFHFGSEISAQDRQFFAQNFDGYLEVRRLNGFTMPQFFSGSSFVAFSSFNGVFELESADCLQQLGFSLMPDVYGVENVFNIGHEGARDIVDNMPLPPDARGHDLLQGDISAAVLYALAYAALSERAGADALLPNPMFRINWETGGIDLTPFNQLAMTPGERERILSWPEFQGLGLEPDIPANRLPGNFWEAFLSRERFSFTHEFPQSTEAVEADGVYYRNILVTDFMVFMMYRRLVELFSRFIDLPLPEEQGELQDFLHYSNFEVFVVSLFNAAAAFSGTTNFRISGVVDTGYKQRHAAALTEFSSELLAGHHNNMSSSQLRLLNDMHNFYLMVFAGQGFAAAANGEDCVVVGVRIHVPDERTGFLMSSLEERNAVLSSAQNNSWYGIRYNLIFYSVALGATSSAMDMRQIFIPIGIVMVIISTVAIAYFLMQAVTKKRKDIGVLKALGASDKTVATVYLLESLVTVILVAALSVLIAFLLYNMTSSILTGAVGWLSQDIINSITIFYLTPIALVVTAVISTAVGLVSTIFPIVKITRLSPVEAIQSE